MPSTSFSLQWQCSWPAGWVIFQALLEEYKFCSAQRISVWQVHEKVKRQPLHSGHLELIILHTVHTFVMHLGGT